MFVRVIYEYPAAVSFDDKLPRRVGRDAQDEMRIEVFGPPLFQGRAQLILRLVVMGPRAVTLAVSAGTVGRMFPSSVSPAFCHAVLTILPCHTAPLSFRLSPE